MRAFFLLTVIVFVGACSNGILNWGAVAPDGATPISAAAVLDTSFGQGGYVVTQVGSSNVRGTSMALQADGRILVAGYTAPALPIRKDIVVARFTASGALDTTFGGTGIVTTDASGVESVGAETYDEQANGIAVDPSGRIYVVGKGALLEPSSDFLLLRYLNTGELDGNFHFNGVVYHRLRNGEEEGAKAIAFNDSIQPVVIGDTRNVDSEPSFGAIRLLDDGALDTAFGSSGIRIIPLSTIVASATSVLIEQGTGNIYMGGSAVAGTDYDFVIASLLPTGNVNQSFGQGFTGVGLFQPSAHGDVLSFAMASGTGTSPRFLMAGSAKVGSKNNFGLAGVLSNGQLDAAFANSGFPVTSMSSGEDVARGVVIVDDKIVLIGNSDSNLNVALARFLPSGQLDTTFGTQGRLVFSFDGKAVTIQAATLTSDGKLLMAGTIADGAIDKLFLGRMIL